MEDFPGSMMNSMDNVDMTNMSMNMNFSLTFLIIMAVFVLFSLYIQYRIISKAGLPGWHLLLVLIASPIYWIYFAFTNWPALDKK